jgi:propionyl-CoA carboxylase alpha chain
VKKYLSLKTMFAENGWAIECRINAEDPFRNFLPSTGRLVRFQPPVTSMYQAKPDTSHGVRVDTGVQEGGEIPMYYDSMIAKLIVHGRDRNDAILKMRDALNGFVIRGINSNIPFNLLYLPTPILSPAISIQVLSQNIFAKAFMRKMLLTMHSDFLIALASVCQAQVQVACSNAERSVAGIRCQSRSDIHRYHPWS